MLLVADELGDIPLDSITLDADLQPRALIREDVLLEYGRVLTEGAVFPPVVVFFDGATRWLADGYHRWHAHRMHQRPTIRADVHQGSRQDALRFALSANARHGLRRDGADMRKAYGIAVRAGLVEPVDVAGVALLLACSERWARELTREAREEADRERDATILAERAAGASVRQVAERVGVDAATVSRVAERKASEMQQPSAPRLVPRAAGLPLVWSQLLAALAAVRALPPLADLMGQPHGEAMEQARVQIGPALAYLRGVEEALAGD